ncbi:hypothetical protein SD81_034565 [Tolypothrix campylonemoides VB511288]|nr:hypothetical protein SD81_034565 [Tolypothrix campylonemoides VB511288]
MTVSLSRHSFIRSSITATTLLAVGCNQPQANLTSASQQSGQPIRLGLSLWTGSSPWQIAEDKGFLKASGVNTEITWFQTLADSFNAFTAGKIDIVNFPLTDLFRSNVNNVPCKVISMPVVSVGADAIIADPSINSVQDFVGKKAAIEIATIGHLLFLQALAKNGVDPKSVQTVNMGADAATSALVAGKVPRSPIPMNPSLLRGASGIVRKDRLVDASRDARNIQAWQYNKIIGICRKGRSRFHVGAKNDHNSTSGNRDID